MRDTISEAKLRRAGACLAARKRFRRSFKDREVPAKEFLTRLMLPRNHAWIGPLWPFLSDDAQDALRNLLQARTGFHAMDHQPGFHYLDPDIRRSVLKYFRDMPNRPRLLR